MQLGFQDEEEDAWSGEVTTVEHTPRALVITGHAPTAALSRERKSQTYLAQTVADIVRDLASAIDIDSVDADTDLSYYAVDHRRSVWGHLLDLADLSGSEITCSATGGLRFLPINALPSSTKFRFGAELLSWRAGAGDGGHAGDVRRARIGERVRIREMALDQSGSHQRRRRKPGDRRVPFALARRGSRPRPLRPAQSVRVSSERSN